MLNEQHVGSFLRDRRVAKGWTLGQLALRSGIHKSTLSRWEAGRTTPKIPELEAALDALEVPPAERALSLALIRAPRAAVSIRGGLSLPGGIEEAHLPPGGALLRALRGRSGMTPLQAAEALRVSTASISQWENSARQPSSEHLERIFDLFNAHPEERQVLSGGALRFQEREEAPAPEEELRSQLEPLMGRAWSGEHLLMDLQFLAAEEYCWRVTVEGKAGWGPDVLGVVFTWHSIWLRWRQRPEEANLYARRSMNLGTETTWIIRNLVESSKSAPGKKLDDLLDWLPKVNPEDHGLMYHTMTEYSSASGRHELALSFADEQQKAAEPSDDFWTHRNASWSRAKALLRAGRPQEALKVMPEGDQPHFLQQIEEGLFRAEAHGAVGEMTAARQHMSRAHDAMTRYQLWVPEAQPLLYLLQ